MDDDKHAHMSDDKQKSWGWRFVSVEEEQPDGAMLPVGCMTGVIFAPFAEVEEAVQCAAQDSRDLPLPKGRRVMKIEIMEVKPCDSQTPERMIAAKLIREHANLIFKIAKPELTNPAQHEGAREDLTTLIDGWLAFFIMEWEPAGDEKTRMQVTMTLTPSGEQRAEITSSAIQRAIVDESTVKLCGTHRTKLRNALVERGLGGLLAKSADEAREWIEAKKHDPLLAATINICMHAAQEGVKIAALTGCPLCELVRECTCGDPETCSFNGWIEIAADEQRMLAVQSNLIAPHLDG